MEELSALASQDRETPIDHGVMGNRIENDSFDGRKFKEHSLHRLEGNGELVIPG